MTSILMVFSQFMAGEYCINSHIGQNLPYEIQFIITNECLFSIQAAFKKIP